ncbi:hypothetical protein BX666DRAFT_1939384 [Dichotomocladium elegans]|nr:hypothetical protein BX666DRAFT_1939384 [Dichotomocladium elegans]
MSFVPAPFAVAAVLVVLVVVLVLVVAAVDLMSRGDGSDPYVLQVRHVRCLLSPRVGARLLGCLGLMAWWMLRRLSWHCHADVAVAARPMMRYGSGNDHV